MTRSWSPANVAAADAEPSRLLEDDRRRSRGPGHQSRVVARRRDPRCEPPAADREPGLVVGSRCTARAPARPQTQRSVAAMGEPWAPATSGASAARPAPAPGARIAGARAPRRRDEARRTDRDRRRRPPPSPAAPGPAATRLTRPAVRPGRTPFGPGRRRRWLEPPPSQGLHEFLLRRGSGGGRRARTPSWRAPTYARLMRRSRRSLVVRSGRSTGAPAPTDPTRLGREAGVSPAQSRYGDRPSGAEVRSPTCRRRSSLREKGQAHPCDPPPDPRFGPRSRGLPFPHLPVSESPRGRTLPARAPSPAARRPSLAPSWPILVAGVLCRAGHEPRAAPHGRAHARHRASARPTPRRTRRPSRPVPGRADRRRGRQRPRSTPSPTADRDPHARRDRDPVRARASATASWARSRTSPRSRPRRPPIPDVARFGSVDVEKIVGLESDLVIAGGDNFNPPEAIDPAARAWACRSLVCSRPTSRPTVDDIELIGRAVGQVDEAAAIRPTHRGRVRRGRDGDRGPRRRRACSTSSTRPAAFYGPHRDYFGDRDDRDRRRRPADDRPPDGVYQIEPEQILDFDPEVILLGDAAYGVTPEQVASGPAGPR